MIKSEELGLPENIIYCDINKNLQFSKPTGFYLGGSYSTRSEAEAAKAKIDSIDYFYNEIYPFNDGYAGAWIVKNEARIEENIHKSPNPMSDEYYTSYDVIVRDYSGEAEPAYFALIDKAGSIVFTGDYTHVKFTDSKLCNVLNNGRIVLENTSDKFGAVDKTGKVIIPFEYDDICVFMDTVTAAKKDGVWYLIDIDGNVVSKTDYDYLAGRAPESKVCVAMKNNELFVVMDGEKVPGSEMIAMNKYDTGSGGMVPDHTIIIERDNKYGYAVLSGQAGDGGSSVSTHTVKFETNGGSKVDSINVTKSKTVAEPTAPTKDGFEFAGWYTDKALTTKYDFSEKVTKGITLYAAWTEKNAKIKDDNTEPTTPENKITFTDVKENDWFCENVKYVFENGLMSGTTDTEFAPNDNLTRAMLVTILYRADGEPETNKSVPFADVTADSYYANAVIWAQQNGIVSGVNENEFAPDENITREQIAAIIYRYAKYKGYDTSAKADISVYADAEEISEYAAEAMQYAAANGLINGKTKTTLNPKDFAARAEFAAILQRFIEGNK